VVVEFTRNAVFINAGGGQARVDNFLMLHDGTAVPHARFTFTPTEVANVVTLNIGGTLHFSAGQTTGNYTGAVTLTANLQ
jgi:hypothetical protein